MKKCVKCGKKNFLSICSKACDGNYYSWNELNGSGYIPTFSSLTDGSDGCDFTICIECGWIVGLNLAKLKKDVKKAFQDVEESETNESEESE